MKSYLTAYESWTLRLVILLAGMIIGIVCTLGLLIFAGSRIEISGVFNQEERRLKDARIEAKVENLKRLSSVIMRRFHTYQSIFDVRLLPVLPADADGAKRLLDGRLIAGSQPPNWRFLPEIRDVDLIRLTFRGNGIPEHPDILAESAFIRRDLRAYYGAILEPNGVAWRSNAGYEFELKAVNQRYRAISYPFISVQKVAPDFLVRKRMTSVPALRSIYLPDGAKADPAIFVDDARSRRIWNRDAPAIAVRKPGPADDGNSGSADAKAAALRGALISQIARQMRAAEQPPAATSSPTDKDRDSARQDRLEERLRALLSASLDPNQTGLFLLDTLIGNYEIFSVISDDVAFSIRSLQTRLNAFYVSFEITFEPVDVLADKGDCRENRMTISDEFLFISLGPDNYLIRIYLPDCGHHEAQFLDAARLLDGLRFVLPEDQDG